MTTGREEDMLTPLRKSKHGCGRDRICSRGPADPATMGGMMPTGTSTSDPDTKQTCFSSTSHKWDASVATGSKRRNHNNRRYCLFGAAPLPYPVR